MIASCQTVDSVDSITATTHTHPVKIHAVVQFDCLLCFANEAGALEGVHKNLQFKPKFSSYREESLEKQRNKFSALGRRVRKNKQT